MLFNYFMNSKSQYRVSTAPDTIFNDRSGPMITTHDKHQYNMYEYARRFYDLDTGELLDQKSNINTMCGRGSTIEDLRNATDFEQKFADFIGPLVSEYVKESKTEMHDIALDSLPNFLTTSSLTFSQLFFLCLFLIFSGLFGIIFSRLNILIVLMSIELVLLGVSLLFILFSVFLQNADGQIFALIILTVAAAEAAAGLAILVVHNRLTKTILLDNISVLRG